MNVLEKKIQNLKDRMTTLGIKEEDLIEKYILGSGSGGQKINKTCSCVYLKHIPSGIEIKCQQERSRALNRFFARRELCDKLEMQRFQEKSKKQQEFEKIRRQKKRRSRKSKEKILIAKHRRSELKTMRKYKDAES